MIRRLIIAGALLIASVVGGGAWWQSVQQISVSSGEAAGLTFISPGQVALGVGATSKTFSASSFGAADVNRYIIVGVSVKAIVATISSVTIGGVTATQHVYQGNAGGNGYAAIYGAAVPTGTTGDIVVTQDVNIIDMAIAVWRKTGAATNTASATGTAVTATTADPAWTLSFNIPASGVGLYVQTNQIGANAVWSGATADYTATTNGGQSGFARSTTVESPHVVTYSPTGGTFDIRYAVGASWVIN